MRIPWPMVFAAIAALAFLALAFLLLADLVA
jgi:hypothetical protein